MARLQRLRTLVVGLALVALLALVPGCSFFMVRPVQHETIPDGTARPTCFTNSYAWPLLDAIAAAILVVGPILELRQSQDACRRGDEDCSSTDGIVIAWVLAAPVPAASAWSGFRAVRQCRSADSPSRWNR